MGFLNILRSARHPITRWMLLVVGAFIGLQFFFLAKIALMARISPESTTFERSQAWQILQDRKSTRLNSSHSQQSRMPSSA